MHGVLGSDVLFLSESIGSASSVTKNEPSFRSCPFHPSLALELTITISIVELKMIGHLRGLRFLLPQLISFVPAMVGVSTLNHVLSETSKILD